MFSCLLVRLHTGQIFLSWYSQAMLLRQIYELEQRCGQTLLYQCSICIVYTQSGIGQCIIAFIFALLPYNAFVICLLTLSVE